MAAVLGMALSLGYWPDQPPALRLSARVPRRSYQPMSKLEQMLPNAAVRGILPDCVVTVVSVQWFGSEALELTYKTPTGRVPEPMITRPAVSARRRRRAPKAQE
jgi:hypothetical protein